MKKITLIGFLIAAFALNGFSAEKLIDKVKFASVDKAKALLTAADEFTDSWSRFDIESRMQKPNSTKEELFGFIAEQARQWNPDEQNRILTVLKSIDEQIQNQGFKINFPEEIYFVKTTAQEAGGALAYTRANYVVVKDGFLESPKEELKMVIIHELFHILTRNNPEFRKEMYKIIGFQLMNEVEYPEELKAHRITNPDAPQTDSYINLKVDGESKDCMMILYSDKDYDGGVFFSYLKVGFLCLKGDSTKTIQYKNGKPVIYSFDEVDEFYKQVGRNTRYIIHPEEILADNFSFAVLNKTGLPSQEIVSQIQKKLKE